MATRAVNKTAKEGEQNARLLLSRGALSAMAIFRRGAFPSVRRWRCTAPYPAARPSRARTLSFVLLMGRRSPSPAFGGVFMRGWRQLFGAGRIQAFVHGKIFANALSGDWQWQYTRAVRPQVPCRGKISPRCVPGRQSVAIFSPHVSQKWPRTGKSPVRDKIRAPCIRNELALAGYARHASEKPCKQPFGDTPREDLAMKGPLSLHGPLESCTARISCRPP